MRLTYQKKHYDWMQVTVPYYEEFKHFGQYNFDLVQACIKYKIYPAVVALNKRGLINGVYVMNHAGLDLRLSSKDWETDYQEIRYTLYDYGITGELKPWSWKIAGEGETEFNHVDVEMLIATTKALFSLAGELGYVDNGDYPAWYHKRPALWVHYMYNQFGYKNIEEAYVHWENFYHQSMIALRVNYYTTPKTLSVAYKAARRNLRKWLWQMRYYRLLGFGRRLKYKWVNRGVKAKTPIERFDGKYHPQASSSEKVNTTERKKKS